MQKFIVVISSIFEFVFYTFFMVLIGSIPFTNKLLELFVYFVSLLVVALAFYFLLRFLFAKLGLKKKKYIYYVSIWNLILGGIAPVLLMIIIPNDTLTNFSFLILVSTIYYGILINMIICIFHYFFSKEK